MGHGGTGGCCRSTPRSRRDPRPAVPPWGTFGEEAGAGRPGSARTRPSQALSRTARPWSPDRPYETAMRRPRALAAQGPGETATPQRAATASSSPSNSSDTFDAHAQTTLPDADTTGTDLADPPDERPAGHSMPHLLGTQSRRCRARTLPPAQRHAVCHTASHSWPDAHSALMVRPQLSMTRSYCGLAVRSDAGSYATLHKTQRV